MGVELFGILFLIVLAGGAVLFFTGAFGARAAKPGPEGTGKPEHAFVENETRDRIVGGPDTADRLRAEAEKDPDTEVRG